MTRSVRSRSVERFSHTMRVLARREPVGRREARLVVTPGRSAVGADRLDQGLDPRPPPAPRCPTPRCRPPRCPYAAPPPSAPPAVVAACSAWSCSPTPSSSACAVAKVITWPWVAIPATLLVAWLVACRVMVKGERAAARRTSVAPRATTTVSEPPSPRSAPRSPRPTPPSRSRSASSSPSRSRSPTPSRPRSCGPPGPGTWCPRRCRRTSPSPPPRGVRSRRSTWTPPVSGPRVATTSDSALAREAEQQQAAERSEREAERRRATGS